MIDNKFKHHCALVTFSLPMIIQFHSSFFDKIFTIVNFIDICKFGDFIGWNWPRPHCLENWNSSDPNLQLSVFTDYVSPRLAGFSTAEWGFLVQGPNDLSSTWGPNTIRSPQSFGPGLLTAIKSSTFDIFSIEITNLNILALIVLLKEVYLPFFADIAVWPRM